MRIGHGYDAHRFGGERPLVIGGVHIEYGRQFGAALSAASAAAVLGFEIMRQNR